MELNHIESDTVSVCADALHGEMAVSGLLCCNGVSTRLFPVSCADSDMRFGASMHVWRSSCWAKKSMLSALAARHVLIAISSRAQQAQCTV